MPAYDRVHFDPPAPIAVVSFDQLAVLNWRSWRAFSARDGRSRHKHGCAGHPVPLQSGRILP
jgi:hypothetical protein